MSNAGPTADLYRPSLDPHVSLALSLTARPGATVIMAGAGLSVGAGVPAAWEVQRSLLARAAAAGGESPDDVFEWWRGRTGVDATYDDVLFATARTPLARKDLLRPFFEPTDDERAAEVKVPSAAHHAIARLMRDGLVRVVLTLNFDLLIESALRDLGIEPTIVSTVADVQGMEPLHAQRYLVWHLHGDYTNPEMLNTPDELRTYDDVVNRRLDELFDQYGLVVVGWSGVWDPALRSAVARCSTRRYPTFWLAHGDLYPEARNLAHGRDATVVQGSADKWLTQVADACDAVRDRARDPLTVQSAAAAVKRELGLSRRPNATHDRIAAEVERLAEVAVLQATVASMNAMTYVDRLPVLEAELEMWAGLVGAAAYWGNEETDRWWYRQLPNMCEIPRLGGLEDLINSFVSPGVVGLFAAGVAAAAAERWELVCDLLTGIPGPMRYKSGRAPALAVIGPAMFYSHSPWPSRSLFDYLSPILAGPVGLGLTATRDAWERFEYLNWLVNVYRNQRGEESCLAYPVPYLRVVEDYSAETSRRETIPLASLYFGEDETARRVVLERLFHSDEIAFTEVVDLADGSISDLVNRLEFRQLPPGGGWMPSGKRYASVARYAGTDRQ